MVLLLAVLALLALAPTAQAQHPPPPPPPSGLSITAQPALYPGFNRNISDYVVRCTGSSPVQVTVSRPSGTRVIVDKVETHSSTSTVPVNLNFGQSFTIVVISGGTTTNHYVRCLPSDFFQWTASRSGTPQAEWYIVDPSFVQGSPYVAIFDTNGVPVWFMKSTVPTDAKLLSNGNLAWTRYSGGEFTAVPGTSYEERRLDGSLVRNIAAVGVPTDFHDLQRLSNGNYLLLAYRPRDNVDLTSLGGPSNATVLDGEVQEVTPAGALVWSWNSKDHIATSETPSRWFQSPRQLPDGRSAYDIVHINSVEATGTDLLLSFRHLDAVYRIRKSDGAVVWKLGGTNRPESLNVVGDPAGANTFGGQHDARQLADGTTTVYDNRTGLGQAPRGVSFRINATTKTAQFLEEVKDASAPNSFCCGSVRRLPKGNWAVSWTGSPLVTESITGGGTAFRLNFSGGFFSYRAVPVAPGVLSRTALRAGMDTQNPRP